MIKVRNRPKLLKLDLSNGSTSSVDSSSKTTSHSEDEVNPDWQYDTWELNSIIKKAKKKEADTHLDDFFTWRNRRKVQKNKKDIPLILIPATSSQDTISPGNKKSEINNDTC